MSHSHLGATSACDVHVECYHDLVVQASLALDCPECWLSVFTCLESYRDVARASCTCHCFHILIGDETLWRRICVRRAVAWSQQLTFCHSWLYTALNLPLGATEDLHGVRAAMDQTRWDNVIAAEQDWQDELPRVHVPSVEVFRRDFDLPQQPVCLTGVETGLSDWSLAALRRLQGSVEMTCSVQEASMSVRMTLDNFASYIASAWMTEIEPIYLFEPRPPAPMLASLRTPACLAKDYAAALEMAAHMCGTRSWLVIGGARSGSRFHIDPVSADQSRGTSNPETTRVVMFWHGPISVLKPGMSTRQHP